MAIPHSTRVDAVPSEAQPQVRELLDDILRSTPFRTSRQCQDMFRYIVEHSLAASDDLLRERVIGIEVFGRTPDYDTAEDPVVRVRAADVRKRLAQYYQTQDSTGQWKIEIPTGSYKAHFHQLESAASQVEAVEGTQPASEERPGQTRSITSPRKRYALWVLGFAIVVTGALAGLMLTRQSTSSNATVFDLFWEPLLENARPVLVCAGSNSVYVLSDKAREKYRTIHSQQQEDSPNLEVVIPPEELKSYSGDDFIPVKDRFLTTGDASAIAQISALLALRHHAYDVRFGTDFSFGDLRNNSAVLIGAFNNSWTLNTTDNLRFVYDSGDSPQMHIKDKFDASRSWRPKALGEKNSEDYAIVSRILDSNTGSVHLTIAGLTHRGTQAAGYFTTSPELIAEFAKEAPKGWNRKNLQIVIHTSVVNDNPESPTVAATYFW